MKLTPFLRRGSLAAVVVATAALATAASTHAALIAWGAPTGITGDSDVSTAGTLVGAVNVGAPGVGSTTVNGVRHEWKAKDTFSAPVFAAIEHKAAVGEPAFLVRIHDAPLQEKIGCYEERGR